MFRALILTAALLINPALANHKSNHLVTVPLPPKRSDAFKNWKPPLEIQNKVNNVNVLAPVKK